MYYLDNFNKHQKENLNFSVNVAYGFVFLIQPVIYWLRHVFLCSRKALRAKTPVFLVLVVPWLPVSAFPVRLTSVVVHVQGEVLLDHVWLSGSD